MQTQEGSVDSRACALIAARAADSKKASDIMVQEVRELIGLTDYFVIVTAQNNRQVDAIVDEVEERLRLDAGLKPFHCEGTQDGTWALLDYGAIVVHVFQPETREYYRLEALWNDAPIVDLAREAGMSDLQYSTRIAKLLQEHAVCVNGRVDGDGDVDADGEGNAGGNGDADAGVGAAADAGAGGNGNGNGNGDVICDATATTVADESTNVAVVSTQEE